MATPSLFFRAFFFFLSLIFTLAFVVSTHPYPTSLTYIWGGILGIGVGLALLAADLIFKRFSFRAFNIAVCGLFFGYLMALALVLIFNAICDITSTPSSHPAIAMVKIFLFLWGSYLGVMMALRASDEIYVSLPFIKLTPAAKQTKEILLDITALHDTRIIDLAASGLLDKRLVLPRFLLRELQQMEDEADEAKVKRAFETLHKLEMLPDLHLRYHDTDFPEIKESSGKILRLARLIDADVLISEINRIPKALAEEVKIINLNALAQSLKPLMQKGEPLKIKIQRHGKEEMQGVGYLEDGTMVVVNGGGGFIGETIATRVLSVKHTGTGRMVFCNVAEEGAYAYEASSK